MTLAMDSSEHCLSAVVLLAMIVISSPACSGSPPTAPTIPNAFAGSWSGTITDFEAGGGTVRVELAGAVGSMRGAWSTVMFGTSTNSSGTLTEYLPAESPTTRGFDCGCTEERRGVLTLHFDGQRMSGRYFLTDCAGLSFGTMELTKGG